MTKELRKLPSRIVLFCLSSSASVVDADGAISSGNSTIDAATIDAATIDTAAAASTNGSSRKRKTRASHR